MRSFTSSSINDDFPGGALVSKGIGRNYGIEITFEKFFTHNFYFLITHSLFNSQYQPLDGNWYSTRYNNNYITNLVGGKEWLIRGKNILGVNTRFTWSGGRRDTPLDLSHLNEYGYYDPAQTQRNAKVMKDYLRCDLGISYKVNKPRVSYKYKIDVQNVTNRANEAGVFYNDVLEKEVVYTLQGILPSFSFQVFF